MSPTTIPAAQALRSPAIASTRARRSSAWRSQGDAPAHATKLSERLSGLAGSLSGSPRADRATDPLADTDFSFLTFSPEPDPHGLDVMLQMVTAPGIDRRLVTRRNVTVETTLGADLPFLGCEPDPTPVPNLVPSEGSNEGLDAGLNEGPAGLHDDLAVLDLLTRRQTIKDQRAHAINAAAASATAEPTPVIEEVKLSWIKTYVSPIFFSDGPHRPALAFRHHLEDQEQPEAPIAWKGSLGALMIAVAFAGISGSAWLGIHAHELPRIARDLGVISGLL